nr:MAG TPA: Type II secretion system, protein M [Caudoviricetes sp.]
MYDKIKILLNHPTYRYIIIGGIGFILILCLGYIFYQPNGADYQRARESVERIEKQQRESLELNRSIQRTIDRSADYSREAATRIERSQDYNRQINDRIGQSQSGFSEARSYLIRNVELFDRIERSNRERQENNQAITDATQPIPNTGRGCDNRSSNSSMIER